ncbi:hypothetical protein QQ045_018656 [Rhodiola kirilowii]
MSDSASNSSPVVTSPSGVGSGALIASDDPYFVNNNELTALSGRYKLGFVDGKYLKPDDVVMAARWQRCNDVVMSWLINSVSEKIVGEILHAKDVVTAWEILESSYAGELSVAMYKRKLELLWQDLDGLKVNKCTNVGKCPCYKQTDEDCKGDRVIKFFMGLNDEYASVRIHVFALSEMPKFSTVYGLAYQRKHQGKPDKLGKLKPLP